MICVHAIKKRKRTFKVELVDVCTSKLSYWYHTGCIASATRPLPLLLFSFGVYDKAATDAATSSPTSYSSSARR